MKGLLAKQVRQVEALVKQAKVGKPKHLVLRARLRQGVAALKVLEGPDAAPVSVKQAILAARREA